MSCPHDYYDSLLNPLLGPLFTYLLQVTLISYTVSGSMWLTNQSMLVLGVFFFFNASFLKCLPKILVVIHLLLHCVISVFKLCDLIKFPNLIHR